jgi:leucyl-tRNA synthetase
LVLLLAPFAPHLSEELWQHLRGEAKPQPGKHLGGERWSVHQQPWPKYDPELVKEEIVTIAVQVNGKVRGQVRVGSEKLAPSEVEGREVRGEIEKLAKTQGNIKKYLKGKKIKKIIFVPGRIINFVTSK